LLKSHGSFALDTSNEKVSLRIGIYLSEGFFLSDISPAFQRFFRVPDHFGLQKSMVLDITESLGCRPSLILDGNTANNSGYSIISLVSLVLGKIIEGNYSINPAGDSLVQESFIKFQSSYEPNVSIDAYLERIHRYSKCSDSCFILMLIYVDRLIEKKSLILTKLNVHRILITT